jgi:hypothetical protein
MTSRTPTTKITSDVETPTRVCSAGPDVVDELLAGETVAADAVPAVLTPSSIATMPVRTAAKRRTSHRPRRSVLAVVDTV